MDVLLSFLSEHLMLVAVFFLALLLLLLEEMRDAAALEPGEAAQALLRGAQAFDIRALSDCKQGMPWQARHVKDSQKFAWLGKGKDESWIVFCQDGQSSQTLVKDLLKRGGKRLYFVRGGIAAWQKEGFLLPSQPGSDSGIATPGEQRHNKAATRGSES